MSDGCANPFAYSQALRAPFDASDITQPSTPRYYSFLIYCRLQAEILESKTLYGNTQPSLHHYATVRWKAGGFSHPVGNAQKLKDIESQGRDKAIL